MLMIPPPSFVSLHNGYFIQTALYVQSGTTDSDLYKGFNKKNVFSLNPFLIHSHSTYRRCQRSQHYMRDIQLNGHNSIQGVH